jgi:hypothetical protein
VSLASDLSKMLSKVLSISLSAFPNLRHLHAPLAIYVYYVYNKCNYKYGVSWRADQCMASYIDNHCWLDCALVRMLHVHTDLNT